MTILRLILCAILGYLLGNIQTGLLLARMTHVDLRKHGSGSSGATNALRVMGRKMGALTFLGDFLKGMLATGLGMLIAGYHGGLVGGLFVVVGHIWPVFYNFHGGKGVAASLGVLTLVLPWHTLFLVVIGILVLAPTKTVSLASLAGALSLLITGIYSSIVRQDIFLLIFVLFMTGLVFFAHRSNIGRILKGTENKLTADIWKKK